MSRSLTGVCDDRHAPIGTIAWPFPVPTDWRGPRATVRVCSRTRCRNNVHRWVRGHTEHDGVFRPFADTLPRVAAVSPAATTSTPADVLAAPAVDGWDLVTAAQAGDRSAFAELYIRYHDKILRFLLVRLQDRHLAEDLTSETFTRALRRINSVSYQGRDFGAWLTTIARNLVYDHIKCSRTKHEETRENPQDAVEFQPARSVWLKGLYAPGHSWVHIPEPRDGGDPATAVAANAVSDELHRCIAQLSDDQRECIRLRFLLGLSTAETARVLKRNEGAVKALQHRAVLRLGQLLPAGLRSE